MYTVYILNHNVITVNQCPTTNLNHAKPIKNIPSVVRGLRTRKAQGHRQTSLSTMLTTDNALSYKKTPNKYTTHDVTTTPPISPASENTPLSSKATRRVDTQQQGKPCRGASFNFLYTHSCTINMLPHRNTPSTYLLARIYRNRRPFLDYYPSHDVRDNPASILMAIEKPKTLVSRLFL